MGIAMRVKTSAAAAAAFMGMAMLALPGEAGARAVVEASGGGMTVNGSNRADQIVVGHDPARPGVVVVSDPVKPYGPFRLGGDDCELGVDPYRGLPEVRCVLEDPRPGDEGARVVVSPHGGPDRVSVGVLWEGKLARRRAFPYKAALIGSFGNDKAFVAGPGSHVGGGHGDDVLVGGGERNIMSGSKGNDRLLDPLGGWDVLHGGQNGDVLAGGPGRDLVTGWSGRDVLLGGAGGDRLYSRDRGHAPDKRIDCGPGRPDEASVQPFDPPAQGCERVGHRGRDLAVGEVDFFNP
jgi:Ca2+-binding RTX toxin-like protein